MTEVFDRRTALKRWMALLGASMSVPSLANLSFTKSNFKAIYGDVKLKDSFYLFLQNVFRLYPEAQFHQMISDLVATSSSDQEIYDKITQKLPGIKTRLSAVTYSLPALKKQREEMAAQAISLLSSTKAVKGYLEIGTTGRYYGKIKDKIEIDGPLFVLNDVSPSYAIDDMFERGAIPKVGTFVPMGNYDDFAGKVIAEESLELVTNYIGFHHSPKDRFEPFARAVWKVLKPGGKLIVRDHDVHNAEMDSMVGLAHDVFNAGVGLTWVQNHDQIRNFTSVAELERRLTKVGFKREGKLVLQDNDPTKNTLMLFTKLTSWKS